MRFRMLIALSMILVAALAFGAGILVQRRYRGARIRAVEDFARDFANLGEPVPAAPAREEWRYPGAETKGRIQGASVRVMEELVRPAGHYAVLVTRDGFEDVARFYAEKAQFEDLDGVATSHLAVASYGTLHESNYLLDDYNDATDPEKLRPVRAKCMMRRCPSYDLTVFITRADDEAHTHIVLLYDPKTETRPETPSESPGP